MAGRQSFLHIFWLFVSFTTSQKICFRNEPIIKGQRSPGTFLSMENQLTGAAGFRPDMKLKEILICEHPTKSHLIGIEFVLRTIGSEIIEEKRLGMFGNNYTDECEPIFIQSNVFVISIEITASDYLDTISVLLSNKYLAFGGKKRNVLNSQKQKWDF